MTQDKDFRIEIVEDAAYIYTPYNADFVKAVKGLGGRWVSENKCWRVNAQIIDNVREAMEQAYGRSDLPAKTVKVKIVLAKDLEGMRSGVSLFGKSICHGWGRDSGAVVDPGASIAGEYGTSGSAKNWYTYVSAGATIILCNVPASAVEHKIDFPEGIGTFEVMDSKKADREQLLKEKKALLERLAVINEELKGA